MACMHCGHGTREHESQGHCFHAAQAEVERLRSRERRVVRVFWRVRWRDGTQMDCDARLPSMRASGGKVYRVTVRRVAKAGRE